MQPSAGIAHYTGQYESIRGELPGSGLAWLEAERAAQLQRFVEVGFPEVRDEAWRYTPLRPITGKGFSFSPAPRQKIDTAPFLIDGLAETSIWFVDGRFRAELSNLHTAAGVSVQPLSMLDETAMRSLHQSFAVRSTGLQDGFAAMNAALHSDGYEVFIDNKMSGAKNRPVIEIVIADGNALSSSQLRSRIRLAGGACAVIVERHLSVHEGAALNNTACQIEIGEGAQLDHYIVQTPSRQCHEINRVTAHLAEHSRFSVRTITLGGAIVRNDLEVVLQGQGAHCDMLGAYNLTGRQHVDNHTGIIHAVPNCTSNELYKGVLGQRARGVFRGRIHVAKDAQKTDAQQANHTLILSADAEIDTRPQLEIYADDVKCSHGATIGRLEESALFYLRSRGIDELQARAMLTYAFINEVIDQVAEQALRRTLQSRLGQQLISDQSFQEDSA